MIPDEFKTIIRQPRTAQNAEDKAMALAMQRSQEAIIDVVKSRTQDEIMALPTEQRWREYGRTYQENIDYNRSMGLNDDGSSKQNNPGLYGNGIIGDIIATALIGGGAVITAGAVAPELFAGGAVAAVPATGAEAAAAVAPVAASVIPVAAPLITEGGSILTTVIAGAGGSATMFEDLIKAATSPGGSSIIGNLINGGSSQQANAAAAAAAAGNGMLTDIAKQALTLAQQASIGQANMTVKANGNTLDTGSGQSVPVWLWPVVGVLAFIAFCAVIVSLFRKK